MCSQKCVHSNDSIGSRREFEFSLVEILFATCVLVDKDLSRDLASGGSPFLVNPSAADWARYMSIAGYIWDRCLRFVTLTVDDGSSTH